MSDKTVSEVPGAPEIPEVLKRPRKTLIAILVIAIVGVASVSGFTLWYAQRASKGEEGPTHSFSIQSTPITGIQFTKNGVTEVTSYLETLEEGLYTIVMPASATVGVDVYNFSQWEDGSTDPSRNVTLTAGMTLTATYVLVPTPLPPLSPGYERFSKYGFSIDYPKDMIILEEGLIDETANDNSGTIRGELFGPYKGFMVSWGKREPPFTRWDLESELDTFFAGPAEREGSLVETTKLGHEMIYHRYSVVANGDRFYGIVGLWYCNIDEKVYILGTKQSTEQDVLQIFERYLDSFVCH